MATPWGLWAARFWAKADKSGGELACWNWTAAVIDRRTKGGQYGKYADRHHRKVSAHRVAYELCHGPIPHGLHVMHSCDNPRCINPHHLSAGTPRDNTHDAIEKGRYGWKIDRCKHGHLFTEENTYIRTNGRRMCRRCHDEAQHRWLDKKRGRSRAA